MFTRDSIVAVRPFTRQREGEDMVIGSLEAGVFLAVPPEAVELLDQLAAGRSVGEVSDLYYQATGETPDLEDLLNLLETKGLVGPNNGNAGGKENRRPVSEPKYHFSSFPQSLARRLFSRSVLSCQAALAVLALAVILRDHALMPVPMDLFFSDRRAFAWTILTVITYAGIFLHELAHLVATRAVGVNSRMGISHRLWYLVAETDLTGLWSVPRTQRYLPMLAGMIVDVTFTSLLVLLLFAEQQRLFLLSPFAVHLLRALAFSNLMRILWEFFLFTRTDLYFVAATFLNCKNLLTDTSVFLRNQVARVIKLVRPVDQSSIPPSEQRAICAYASLFLAGRAWAFVTLFWVTIPVTVSYWGSLVGAFRAGYSQNPSNFLDALVVSLYFLVPTVAGFVFWAGSFARPKGI